jgi:hypothetical protein
MGNAPGPSGPDKMPSHTWSRIEAPVARLPLLLLLLMFSPVAAGAQQVTRPSPVPTESGGVIEGTVTTQNGTIALGAVRVSLSSERTSEVATVLSEGDGTFLFEGLPAGSYQLAAALEGFEVVSKNVTVAYNETSRVPLDLPLAMAQSVDVVARTTSVVPATGTLATGEAISSRQLEEIGIVGGLHAALRLLVGVIEVPGGVAIKGGRPSQASVQLGPGMFVDPATGLSQARLPDDAIDSVTVLPNPYAVEYGRFSSGLVLIQTRRCRGSLENAAEQPRSSVPDRTPRTAEDHRHFSVYAAAGNRGAAHQGSPVPARGGSVPISHERGSQSAAGGSEDRARVQLVYAPGCQRVHASRSGGGRWLLPERVQLRDARHLHAAERRGRSGTAASTPCR